MAYHSGAKSAHIGGGLSIIDITATLFGRVMKVNREDPQDRDVIDLFLVKGMGFLVIIPRSMRWAGSQKRNFYSSSTPAHFYTDTPL